MGHARDTTVTTPDHAAEIQQPGDALRGKEEFGEPETLRRVAEEVRESFLRQMETAELVLIDVDPLTLHAFWRVPLPLFRDAQTRLGPDHAMAPMFLRIEEVGEDGESLSETADVFDVRVSGLQSRAYIDVHSTGRCFRGTLGLHGKNGASAELARSNIARLPPLGPAGQPRPETKHQPVVVPRWQPEAVDATHVDTAPQKIGDRSPHMPPESAVPRPGESWPEELKAQHPAPDGPAFAAHIAHGAYEGAPGQPTELAHLSPETSEPTPVESKPTNEDAVHEPFALDEILPISSYVLAGGGDDVDLEVTAELHIYGRAKPGRAVQLCGKPVRLRPDGSFSIRRILPNDPLIISALLASTDAPGSEENE